MLEPLLRWLARQWPRRPEIREAEWLAEVDTLPAGWPQLRYVLGVGLATLRLQPRPLMTAGRWLGLALWWSARQVARSLSLSEQEVMRRGWGEFAPMLPPGNSRTQSPPVSEEEKVAPFDFSVLEKLL